MYDGFSVFYSFAFLGKGSWKRHSLTNKNNPFMSGLVYEKVKQVILFN